MMCDDRSAQPRSKRNKSSFLRSAASVWGPVSTVRRPSVTRLPGLICIKATYKGFMTTAFAPISEVSLEFLLKKVSERFKLVVGSFTLGYEDFIDEQQVYQLSSEREVIDCLKECKKADEDVLQVVVTKVTDPDLVS